MGKTGTAAATQPITQWIGDFGEGFVKSVLEARGYRVVSLQNRSGHGIDAVAIKKVYGRWIVLAVEIKATAGARAGTLTRGQKEASNWVRSRLRRAARGWRGYRSLSAEERALAATMLELIKRGFPVGLLKVDVTGVGKPGPPKAVITGHTRVRPRHMPGGSLPRPPRSSRIR